MHRTVDQQKISHEVLPSQLVAYVIRRERSFRTMSWLAARASPIALPIPRLLPVTSAVRHFDVAIRTPIKSILVKPLPE
jgi:hypothetical protein